MQVGGNGLEDIKYGCNVSESVARKIAKNVQLDMQQYLLFV
jgi:hypothetical protein